ncbi:hypothetical protein [Halobacillus sp. Marseille-Q1614]|uniref:lipase family alpha/beta hydrolase n=1 Tax=Halobacillus sp. Marseille-Q1614 TaxID=2709134 RepID=UPI00156ED9E8|nr:hypothetical protein [Halobacillus sp. Marseille-Q1614]
MDIAFSHFPYKNPGSSGKDGPPGIPGEWYAGESPSIIDYNKSPIVFIHGLNGSSHIWRDDNDMDDIAYNQGFQTAYADLYPASDMWNNGQLLARQLQEIYMHFGERVIIVAHSKGGIDSQTALVHFGASPYVRSVVTLSSPHHGAELADLAYSSWAGWLAEIIGGKNEATYSLQTGAMSLFRKRTDTQPNVTEVPFYSLAGTGWGTFGTALYWGGLYLRSYGRNDGAVTVESSRLSYAEEIEVRDWNHYEIQQGSSTFPLFHDYLYENTESLQKPPSTYDSPPSAGAYIRGGKCSGEAIESFYVEDGVNSITINWMSEEKHSELTIITPGGEKAADFMVHIDDSSIFQGSCHHLLTVNNPLEGKWTITSKNKNSHYLLSVLFESRLNKELDLNIASVSGLELTFKKMHAFLQGKQISSTIRVEHYHNSQHTSHKSTWDNMRASSKQISTLGEGIYNITVDINGRTPCNYPFNRTIIRSIYMDHNGDLLK